MNKRDIVSLIINVIAMIFSVISIGLASYTAGKNSRR